jgi:hypothetical protein
MKKLSLILAATVLFAGVTFSQTGTTTTKTEKSSSTKKTDSKTTTKKSDSKSKKADKATAAPATK